MLSILFDNLSHFPLKSDPRNRLFSLVFAQYIVYYRGTRTRYSILGKQIEGVQAMQAAMQYGLYQTDQIHFLPIDQITPNPAQPRKRFDAVDLKELSQSIRRYGMLQPLTVRYQNGVYELVAGERRLRASRLAGLHKAPCIVLNVDIEDSSFLALVENLQRRDLTYIEEAEGLSQLISIFDLSQDEAAKRVGKSQSAVANKLRILKLPPDMLLRLTDNKLCERHARALLRLSTNADRYLVLDHIITHKLTVAKTEDYIDDYINRAQGKAEDAPLEKELAQKSLFVIKDVRLFLNTLQRGVSMLQQSGIHAHVMQDTTDDDAIITIRIPRPQT